MKKLLIIMTALVSVLCFTSCDKDGVKSEPFPTSYWQVAISEEITMYVGVEDLEDGTIIVGVDKKCTNTIIAQITEKTYYYTIPQSFSMGGALYKNDVLEAYYNGMGIGEEDLPQIFNVKVVDGVTSLSCSYNGQELTFTPMTESEFYDVVSIEKQSIIK